MLLSPLCFDYILFWLSPTVLDYRPLLYSRKHENRETQSKQQKTTWDEQKKEKGCTISVCPFFF